MRNIENLNGKMLLFYTTLFNLVNQSNYHLSFDFYLIMIKTLEYLGQVFIFKNI